MMSGKRIVVSVPRRIGIFAFCGMILLWSQAATASNPINSIWTSNLSEGLGAEETKLRDSNPELKVSGSVVHALWMTAQGDNEEIWYRRSTDGGQNWEAKKLLFSDDNINQDGISRRLAVDGDHVHVVCGNYDTNPNTGNWFGKLTYIRSTDGGATFGEPRSLYNAPDAYHVYDNHVVVDNGTVNIGFRSQCNWCVNNAYHVYVSSDGGETFSQHTAYSTVTGSGWNVHDLKRTGDHVYVLYSDAAYYYGQQYTDLYLAASNDGGQTFGSQKINFPSANGKNKVAGPFHDINYAPKIAAVGDSVLVAWAGLDESDAPHVFLRRSTDGGVNFGPQQVLDVGMTSTLQAGQEFIVARGNYVYVLFLGTDSRVYMNRSSDGGANFHGLQEITRPSGTYFDGGWWPRILLDPADSTGARAHIFWSGGVYTHTTDGGATWTGYVNLDAPSMSGGWEKPNIAISPDGTVQALYARQIYAYDVWGDWDIFHRRFAGAALPSGTNQSLLCQTQQNYRFDQMQVPPSAGLDFTSAMTAELWVRATGPGIGVTTGYSDYRTPIILQQKTRGSYNPVYAIGTFERYGKRQIYADIKTADHANFRLAPTGWEDGILTDQTWTHLAMTYDAAGGSDNLRLYKDGALIASATVTGGILAADSYFFAAGYGNWQMDEIRLWNRALTASEIMERKDSTLGGNESGLVAYYPLNGSTKDMSGRGNDGVLIYKESFAAGVGINTAPTIGGTPATQVLEGSPYSFVPSASDDDNNAPLSFSIANKPEWASFDTTTGKLSGTPDSGDIGITKGIVISVTDGTSIVSLAPFDLKVAGTASFNGKVLISVAGHTDLPALSAIVIIDETGEEATVDSSGAYSFTGLGSGAYTVRAKIDGLADRTGTVTLSANQTLQMETIHMVAAEFTREDLAQAEAAKDAVIAQKEELIRSMFTAEQVQQAVAEAVRKYDADGDGKLGLAEAIRILQIMSGMAAEN